MSKIVERTLDFIELFAAQGRPLALSDISRLLKIPISSCHDVVQSLQTRGYITEITPRGGYYPTMRLHALANQIARNDPLAQRAQQLLMALRDQLDETVSLGKATSPLNGMHLMVFESANPLRFLNTPGSAIKSLYATSAGKVLLGALESAAFEAWLEQTKLTPMTPKTILSKPQLRSAIAEGRNRGWYRNDEESAPGVTTIGASFDWLRVTYFVTVAGPTQRMIPDMERNVEALIKTCEQLGQGNFD